MRLRLIILSDNLAAKVAFCSAAYAFFSRAASLTPPLTPILPPLVSKCACLWVFSSGTQCFKSSWWLSVWPGWLMAVICGGRSPLCQYCSVSPPISPPQPSHRLFIFLFFCPCATTNGNDQDDVKKDTEVKNVEMKKFGEEGRNGDISERCSERRHAGDLSLLY